MPEGLSGSFRVRLVSDFLMVLLLVGAGASILLFLAALAPPLCLVYPVLWLFALTLDAYTTWPFYSEDPSQFRSQERSRIFTLLAGRLSFKHAVIVFTLLVEVPLAIIMTFTLIPPISSFLAINTDITLAFSSSLGVLGLAHLQAATRNRKTRGHHSPVF